MQKEKEKEEKKMRRRRRRRREEEGGEGEEGEEAGPARFEPNKWSLVGVPPKNNKNYQLRTDSPPKGPETLILAQIWPFWALGGV